MANLGQAKRGYTLPSRYFKVPFCIIDYDTRECNGSKCCKLKERCCDCAKDTCRVQLHTVSCRKRIDAEWKKEQNGMILGCDIYAEFDPGTLSMCTQCVERGKHLKGFSITSLLLQKDRVHYTD